MTGNLIWIPAVMVFLHFPVRSIGERFWLPISTGCAAHSNIAQALVNALCEVIERDALSITWLARLSLPRLSLKPLPEALAPYLQRYRHSHITPHFFDATTDLGIPTIYAIHLSPHHERLATVVMCATDLDPVKAITKVICESASVRIALQNPNLVPPSNPDRFITVTDGALYTGAPERQSAFSFLLESNHWRSLSELSSLDTGDPEQNLRLLLERLEACGMEAYAVDLTTDEALRAGMRVVRVIVPGLQPLSFSYRARFLGHPRLYAAPRSMGYAAISEADVNPWPQPFA